MEKRLNGGFFPCNALKILAILPVSLQILPCLPKKFLAAGHSAIYQTRPNFCAGVFMEFVMEPIARIHTDFPTKFGVPRQSGLVKDLEAEILFEPPYRDPAALRGLEGFSHLWLVWVFHQAAGRPWSPTVRPPRLGGNRRMGVFATRSPFRPNSIGLSAVELAGIETAGPSGPVLRVRGADLVDGTPVLDIKPYLPYADCIPEALGGFAGQPAAAALAVEIPPLLLERIPPERRKALRAVLAQDPRPRYQDDPARVYGFTFAGLEVRFTVSGDRLTVREVAAPSEKPPV